VPTRRRMQSLGANRQQALHTAPLLGRLDDTATPHRERVSFFCHMRHWDDIRNENATFHMRIDTTAYDLAMLVKRERCS
jgi:hypothetical protein